LIKASIPNQVAILDVDITSDSRVLAVSERGDVWDCSDAHTSPRHILFIADLNAVSCGFDDAIFYKKAP
jgi:hypothetical protein